MFSGWHATECGFAKVCAISFRDLAMLGRLRTIVAVGRTNLKTGEFRVIFENNELSDTWDSPDDAGSVSVPVSMVLHASGAIEIVVIDLMQQYVRVP